VPSVLRSSTVRFGLFTRNGTGATASIYIITTQKMIQQRHGLPKELLTHRFQEGFQTERGGLTNALGSLATSMHIIYAHLCSVTFKILSESHSITETCTHHKTRCSECLGMTLNHSIHSMTIMKSHFWVYYELLWSIHLFEQKV
jgi:hypothetical protein